MPPIKKPIRKKKKTKLAVPVPFTRKPVNMNDREWQTALRKQIAGNEIFVIKNTGTQPVYSDYTVYSPKSKNTYRIALRSKDNSRNFCACPDFKTNLLGTCKHIEAVRLQLSKKRGIKKLMDEIPEASYSSMYVSYLDERKIKLRVGTANRTKLRQWAIKYFDKEGVLLPKAYTQMEKLLREAHALNPSFRCYDDAIELIIEKREQSRRGKLVEEKNKKLLDGLVKVSLFPYQQEGVLFAVTAGRCILADDMGLGKTIQGIAWARLLQKYLGAQKVIIVCPTSLKYQWKTEIEKFTGEKATVLEGNMLARKDVYENDESFFKIVSYHMAGNDWKYINSMQPDAVILDEAQRIKNWRAKISQNIKRLRSPYALVLTGTPLENNIEELYSLVQYINPYLLGSLHHFLSGHQLRDTDTGKVTGYTGLNTIGQQLSGILLRRTRKEVLKQLPGRMDKNLFVPLTPEQADLHKEYADIVARLVKKWKNWGHLNEQDRQVLLNCLNMMRMVCDSTYIIDQRTNYQTKLDELFNILDELFEMKGEKVVIFSQWERMTRLVAMRLKERGVLFENLHGGIPGKQRESLFMNFNNNADCRVFLSTDAGSVGLNLQTASYLINLDIPWNPAVLEQRIGRIYRMGQKKNVSIINLIAQGSIEHRMISVLKFKTSLAAGILDGGEDAIFLGDDKFKQFMKSVETITQDIPETDTSFDTEERAEIAAAPPATAAEEMTGMVEEEAMAESVVSAENSSTGVGTPGTVIQNGMQFFSQLLQALSNETSTKELVHSITEKDPQTGKTYLKLPVENEETVEKGLNLLAGFLKAFGK